MELPYCAREAHPTVEFPQMAAVLLDDLPASKMWLKLPNFQLSCCSQHAAPNYKSVLEDNFPDVMQGAQEKKGLNSNTGIQA